MLRGGTVPERVCGGHALLRAAVIGGSDPRVTEIE